MEKINGRSIVDSVLENISGNKSYYLLSLFCMCTGLVIGAYCVKYIGDESKTMILNLIGDNLQYIRDNSISYKDIFISSAKVYIPIILMIWFFGLNIIGIPIIFIINILKGFTLGFTFVFLVETLGVAGLQVVFLGVVIQNVVFIPIMIISSAMAMCKSKEIFFSRETSNDNISKGVLKYSLMHIALLGVVCSVSMVQAFISPVLISKLSGVL